MSAGLTCPEPRLFIRARRRHWRWNLTQRPNYRNPIFMGPHASPLAFGFVPHHAPIVYWRETSWQVTAPVIARNFFSCRDFCLAGAEARMRCHEGTHLLEQEIWIRPRSDRMLPLGWGNAQIILAKQSIIGIGFCPRHAHHPLHEAAN
jgi:hypothetical protein